MADTSKINPIRIDKLGEANGVASLDNSGKVPDSQLPTKAINAVQKTGDTMTGTLQINSPNNEIRMIHPDYPEYNGFIRRSTQNFIIGTKDGTTSEWKKSIQITDNAVLVSEPNASANDSQIATTKFVKSLIVTDKINTVFSNAITKIPQDINLTLENGELKLTNSYIYVPNGPDVFEKVNITTSRNWTVEANKTFFLYLNTKSALTVSPVEKAFSGDTAPEGATYAFWYDTANNKIKYVANDGVWQELQTCLPVAVVSSDGTGKIARIDQVFNGFGYIGSVPFILPGVECLRTRGRNTDGTLKSEPTTISTVSIPDLINENISRTEIYINGANSSVALQKGGYVYNEQDNLFYFGTAARNVCFAFSVSRDSTGRILSLTPQNTFHAVDYNGADFVTDSYQDENGNWYRVYKSGWVEQGGHGFGTITFLKPFANTNYTAVCSIVFSPGDYSTKYFAIQNKQTTTIVVPNGYNGSDWQACGQGA